MNFSHAWRGKTRGKIVPAKSGGTHRVFSSVSESKMPDGRVMRPVLTTIPLEISNLLAARFLFAFIWGVGEEASRASKVGHSSNCTTCAL